MREYLEKFSKDQLIDLIESYSKDLVAMDGVWFQAAEKRLGMDEAMEYDKEAWERYEPGEGWRLKSVLGLDEHPGLEGLEAVLKIRYSSHANSNIEITWEDEALVYRIVDCRIQRARQRKGMEFHPCKLAAVLEYQGLATAVDDRIQCECLSCYPDITDDACCCAWRFTLQK